jgi:hypothetical protein
MPVILPPDGADFHAHHSPFGAFASFTVGRHGRKGGFGLELAGPAQQDVYVAVARPGETVRALPFYSGAQTGGAEAYTGAQATSKTQPLTWGAFPRAEITREMGWASDTWRAGIISFTLLTPFGPVPDPLLTPDADLRRHLCPALLAEITVDNTAGGTEAFAFFGVGAGDPLRPLSDICDDCLLGAARETQWGFAALPSSGAREVFSWGIQEAVARAVAGGPAESHRLANRGGLLFTAAPGETRTWTVALGFYRGGVATTGLPASYLYADLFPDLESVLVYALEHADEYRALARERDAELDAAPLSDDRKFLLAHATHSYHGSTMLLNAADECGLPLWPEDARYCPLWAVNEGEYRMLNTFDLTVDHAFWERRWHPWTLRNTLDLFVTRYSYIDDVQDATHPDRPRSPGGLSFTHDMGVANQFTKPGFSSYERPDLSDCFSYMTQEQLVNWCLTAALYALHGVRDHYWLALRRHTLIDCLHSLINRDGPERSRDGVMSLDAARCGTGQEITTYDSLDASLGQARGNAYLAVKTWAAYLALSRCFDALGMENEAVAAEEQAALCAQTVGGHFDPTQGVLPAVFEPDSPGHAARIIPAIEGLAFPFALGDADAVADDGPYGEMVTLLRRHLRAVLVPGVCLDPVSGGFKLSSSSENTWMSKIFLAQFVAERVLGVSTPDGCDAAHAKWQREGASRDWAFTDQVRSADGADLGSRYYPRGVTAVLWL